MFKQGTLNNTTGEISFPTKSLVMVPVDVEGNPIPGGGGGTGDGIVKIDPTQNTVKVDGTVPVSGPVTNDQLRANPINVSGPLTDTQLRATAVTVSGPLTNAQYTAVTGTAAAAIYSDTTGAANGTLVSLLKGIYAQTATNTRKLTEGVNRSGSIDVELESQVLAPANPNRVSLTIQNTSTGDLYVSEFGAASNDGTSAVIDSGTTLKITSSNEVTVTGETAGQTWYATETSI